MALWKRERCSPIITDSAKTASAPFLQGHGLIYNISVVGSCADNAAEESFFGILKRELVNRSQYRT